jgi:arsenate reductase-like glutaredoxin family protein
MVAPWEKSFCVLEYHTSKCVVTVQRAFRAKYAKDPPTDKTIRAWYKQFTETECLCKHKSSRRPLTAEGDVEWDRAIFLHSPKKSTGTAATELSISKTTVWRVLRKRLVFKPYRIQMVQQLSDEDHRRRLDLRLQLQDLMSSDDHFFLWGYVKDRVFVPSLPRDLADLKARIIAAVKNIDASMLTHVWQELEYRIDVCRVTRGAHIESLVVKKKKKLSVFLWL